MHTQICVSRELDETSLGVGIMGTIAVFILMSLMKQVIVDMIKGCRNTMGWRDPHVQRAIDRHTTSLNWISHFRDRIRCAVAAFPQPDCSEAATNARTDLLAVASQLDQVIQ